MDRRSRLGRYPPLLLISVALLICVLVLPSALNLPQTNPATTLEYAPVPPGDDNNPPPGGNLSSLGLASSGTLGASIEGGALPVGAGAAAAAGAGKNPSTKRCVGTPPRQTSDPMSPPCVAYFQGDNFGATYQGVTRDEIRLLIFVDGKRGDAVTSKGTETRPSNTVVDLGEPPSEDDLTLVKEAKLWFRFYNDRYQTYDRYAHGYMYFSRGFEGADSTPAARRADAADAYDKVKPFAVIAFAKVGGNEEAFAEIMAQKGVLNFGAFAGREAAFFQRYPKLVWGYLPSVEQMAKLFAGYVCRKVTPFNVSFSGDQAMRGKPRKLGLLSTSDPSRSGAQQFAKAARREIEKCGGAFAAAATFPQAGTADPSPGASTSVISAMSEFQRAGVTTVIWAQGYDNGPTKGAKTLNYSPEWILAGDNQLDASDLGYYQDQDQFQNAWVVSPRTLQGAVESEPCYTSLAEADPNANRYDHGWVCNGYDLYTPLRQVFTGIQVAGPRLSPTSIDRGFHAIPRIPSTNPRVPSCFYEPDDYTCVKDAAQMWWDRSAPRQGYPPSGCWRMAEGGRRYFSDVWPATDVGTEKKTNDPCNTYVAGNTLRATSQ